MLTKVQNEPFKFTITNLKKIVDTQSLEKEQDQIKTALKTLTQITNLNQLLKILIDDHWFSRLCQVLERLSKIVQQEGKNCLGGQSYQNLPGSPSKSIDKNHEMLLKHTKKIDLTPSTKKSRVLSQPTIGILLEDLIQSLQKFDQIKHNSKRIRLLIEEIYEEVDNDDDVQQDFQQEINVELLWRNLRDLKMEDVKKNPDLILKQEKTEVMLQLLQHIQTIYKFMEVIKATTQDIFILLQTKSLEDPSLESGDSYNLQMITKKSNNPTSQQRSLLTEMLRDSSQKSNFQPQQNEYSSQIVLRPRFKEYSQNQNQAHLDEQFKFSYKSAKPYGKHKYIRSEMNYGGNDENVQVKLPVRRKEVKIKRSQMGCSRCEIF